MFWSILLIWKADFLLMPLFSRQHVALWEGVGGGSAAVVGGRLGPLLSVDGVYFWYSSGFSFLILLKRKLVAMREEESPGAESSRIEESSVRTSLDKLCHELNMDEQTATEAMQNFTAIWNTHTLEVGRVQGWLFQVCSLPFFSFGHRSVPPWWPL